MTTSEHRRAPRISRSFLVRYRCPVEGQAAWLISPMRNFSREGVRFVSEYALFKPGDSMELQLLLPHAKQPISICGRIVWTKPLPFGLLVDVGIAFDPGATEAKEVIAQAVDFFQQPHKPS